MLQGSVTVQSAQSDGSVEGQDPGKTGASVPEMRDPQRIAAVYGPSYEMLAVLGVKTGLWSGGCADGRFSLGQ